MKRWNRAAAWAVPLTLLLGLSIVLWLRNSRRPAPEAPRPAPATVDLRARREATAASEARHPAVEPAGEPLVEPVEPVEPSNLTLRVRLLDYDEEPVGDVRVTLWSANRLAPGTWTPDHPLEAASELDGRCMFEGLPKGGYTVTALPTRHGVEQRDLDVVADSEVVFHLRKAPHVAGTAFLRDRNHPLQFGTIQIATSSGDGSSYEPFSSGRSARTDGEGRFFAGPFKLGEHLITLARRHYQAETIPVNFTAAEPIQEIEVVFKDGIVVRGTVQNLQGVVLPRERISWRRYGSHVSTQLECRGDERGRYEQGGLRPGRHVVEVFGVAPEASRRQEVVLADEPSQEVAVIVDCPRAVPVQVLAPSGQPALEARVEYGFNLPDRSGNLTAEAVDADGWTLIPCVPLGTSLRIQARDEAEGAAKLIYVVTPQNEPAILRLEALEKLRGEVVDSEDRPLKGVEVTALDPELQKTEHLMTDEDGRFEAALAPGAYRLEVKGGRLGAALEAVEVGPGLTPVVHLALRMEPSRSARVRVIGPDGEPLEDASVALFSRKAGPGPEGRTGADGWFLTACDEGEYGVHVEYGGLHQFDPAMVSIPQAPSIEVRMEEPGARSVSGQVLLDGRPVAGARVGLASRDGSLQEFSQGSRCMTDKDGRFSLGTIHGDVVYVLAWGEGFALARSELVAIPRRGQVRNVIVRSLDGEDLNLKLEDPYGASPGHIIVELHKENEPPFSWKGPSAEDGTLTVPRLPPGDYRISLRSRDNGYLCEQKLVWTGSEGPITLRIETEPR